MFETLSASHPDKVNGEGTRMVAALTAEIESLQGRMFYGTSDFCDLLASAHQTYEGTEGDLHQDDPNGFLYLEKPVPIFLAHRVSEVEMEGVLFVRALCWTSGTGTVLSRSGGPANIYAIGLGYDPNGEMVAGKAAAFPPLTPELLAKAKDRSYRLVRWAELDVVGAHESVQIVLAALTLLRQPGVVEVEETQPTSEEKKRARKRRHKEPEPVSVIDLRHKVKKDVAEVAAAERTYHHRWIVRGHWRKQACGPQQRLRRSIYVAPYVKGPDDAPLLQREKVYRW